MLNISSNQLQSFADPESITEITIENPFNAEDLIHLAKFTNLESVKFSKYIGNLDLSQLKLPQSIKKIDLLVN